MIPLSFEVQSKWGPGKGPSLRGARRATRQSPPRFVLRRRDCFRCARNDAPLGGQHLEQVTVRVAEIETAPTIAMIDLHILRGARTTAVGEAFGADPAEDSVEFRFADLEGVVVPLEAVPIVEIDRQGLIDPHGSEM